MKNLTIVFCFTILSQLVIAQTCPPSIDFETQLAIDNFPSDYPGCTQILGGVQIFNYGGDISNLMGLSSLTSIGDYLGIYGNAALTSLAGLNALTSVGGDLRIEDNAALTSLTGLSSLTSIGGNYYGGSLGIENNAALTSLAGLSSLTSIGDSYGGGQITIYGNAALTSLTGLFALTIIRGGIYISNNAVLTSLTGLDNIDPTTIPEIILHNSKFLSLCEVKSICDYLAIPSNYASISGNAAGCSTRAEVVAACLVPAVNLENPKVNVFPNPTNGIIEIQGISRDEGIIRLTDYLGRLIILQRLVESNQIDISNLPNGMYMIQILNDRKLSTKRIIKE